MNKTKVLTRVLSAVLGILLIALLVGNLVAQSFTTIITTYFGHDTIKIKNIDESGASDYFTSDFDTDEELANAGAALCEEIEAEGLVLLKNTGVLPLGENKKVSLFSESSVDIIYGGTGSGSVDTSTAKTLKDVFEEEGYEVNSTLWNFYMGNHETYSRSNPSIFAEQNNFEINECPVSEYSDEVKNSFASYNDAAIVVISRSGGEGDDLTRALDESEGGGTYLQLTNDEKDMLQMVTDNFENVIVLVNSSNAMELGFIDEEEYGIDACIWIGGVGQTGLSAVAKAVVGTVNPSGRLVDTYAYDSLSSPAMQNFGSLEYTNAEALDSLAESYFGIMTQYTGKNYVVYQEGIYVGYRYYETRYEDTVLGTEGVGNYNYSEEVQFPFGYGLSYTSFDYSNYKMTESEDVFTISVDVTNSGNVEGKEVVQIYLQSPYTEYDKQYGIEKASVELCGFAKTDLLSPGETETVTISVDKEELRTYDANGAGTYIVDAGEYYFTAAYNAHDAVNNILAAKGYTTENGMDEEGDSSLTSSWTNSTLDKTTYATSSTGTAIVNQFADADIKAYYDDIEYLSRSDWTGTFPETIVLTATDELIADLSEKYDLDDTGYTMPATGVKNGISVIELKGLDYDDPMWDELLDELTVEDMITLVSLGGYQTSQLDSINYPGTTDQDGPAGISATLVGGGTKCMAYPAEVVMASTYNTELIYKVGEFIGEDGLHGGVEGWYAPAMNTHRTPYSGRNFEYFSEDGFLSGEMAASEVDGVQSKGVFCYIKHFAINDQETNRKGIATFANEQSIREIYLTAFEHAVREGNAHAVMTSHNRIGATWAAGCSNLINSVLRAEWGFVGHVVTDYVSTPVYQSALQALLAGNDLMLCTNSTYEDISQYKTNAKVVTALREASHNILYTGVNSSAMNGYSSETEIVQVLPLWKWWLIAFDIVVVALIIAAYVALYKNYKKKVSAELKTE